MKTLKQYIFEKILINKDSKFDNIHIEELKKIPKDVNLNFYGSFNFKEGYIYGTLPDISLILGFAPQKHKSSDLKQCYSWYCKYNDIYFEVHDWKIDEEIDSDFWYEESIDWRISTQNKEDLKVIEELLKKLKQEKLK